MLNFRQRGNDALFLFCGREVHLFGYGSKTEKKHTNGDCLRLGKQHAIHKLVHLGIPQQELNDNSTDWS